MVIFHRQTKMSNVTVPRCTVVFPPCRRRDIRSFQLGLQGIDLFLNLVKDTDASYKGNLLFNAAIFAQFTAENTLMRLQSLLRDAVAAPDERCRGAHTPSILQRAARHC